jgi:membrane protein implicated in regulation of membrane protease activity
MSETGGLVGSARRVVAHGAALLRLERELAKAELERKTGVLGAGVFLSVAAGILALFALGFGLATLAAALALVVDWWLALLIVFALLVVIVVVLALVARSLFRNATPLKPVQALEEAQRTKEVLRGVGGDRA